MNSGVQEQVMRVEVAEIEDRGFKRLCEGRIEKCRYLDIDAKIALVSCL